jgi:selenide,water dikinase
VFANAGAQPGDALILTKPIGTGVIATALKFNRAPQEAVDAAVRSMIALNAAAADVLSATAARVVHACTDVTGFGLIGHASEMAAAGGCTLEIDSARVPLIDGALGLVRGNVPGGGRTNRDHFGTGVSVRSGVNPDVVDLLYDPQTSGGLLAAIAPSHAADVLGALAAASIAAVQIGRVAAVRDVRIAIS